jgi:16S rRNA (guanine(966)-N(2))-methyltransferase RsmD
MENASFLDLFAGTGRVGFEALRRGASRVVMVEVLKDRARNIERDIRDTFAGTEKLLVLSLELRRSVAWLVKREERFQVIFADPPYNEGWGAELLQTKGLGKLLEKGGVLVMEHSSREALYVPPGWGLTDTRAYGETTLTFVSPLKDPLAPAHHNQEEEI